MGNNESGSWQLWAALIILVLIAIAVIRFIIGGAVAFFQTEEIWKWILVVLALVVFVAIVMNADRRA